jgi:hypothetical protein
MATNSLANFLTLAEYRAERPSVFPSQASVEWFVRQRYAEMLAAGALVKIAGRLLVDPEITDTVAVEHGLAMARGEKPVRVESRKPAAPPPPPAPGEPPRRARGRPRKSETTSAAV